MSSFEDDQSPVVSAVISERQTETEEERGGRRTEREGQRKRGGQRWIERDR